MDSTIEDEQRWITQEIILENDRVRLEPLSIQHLEELLPMAIEPELWALGVTQIRNRDDLVAYVEEAIKHRAAKISYSFVIIDKSTGSLVGSTRYYDISMEHRRLSIGWTWLSKSARGSGINTSCKFELLRFAFETVKVHRVQFRADALNERSRAAIRKLGATQEGILRSHMVTYDGRVRDSVIHSILFSEWPQIRTEIFKK